jgi:hypothetical protein
MNTDSWVFEGSAMYFGNCDVSGVRNINPDIEVNNCYSVYIRALNSGRDQILYKSNSLNNDIKYYKSTLIMYIFDKLIRATTQNKTIIDFWAQYYSTLYGMGITWSNITSQSEIYDDVMIQVLNDITGVDTNDFWGKYIYDKQPLPLSKENNNLIITEYAPKTELPMLAVSVYEDVPDTVIAELNTIFSDPLNSELVFSISEGNNYARLVDTVLLTDLPLNFNGTVPLTISANNSLYYPTLFHIDLTVLPVNDPPAITDNHLPTAYCGVEYTFPVQITDPDSSEHHTFSLITSPDWMTVSNEGILTAVPPQQDAFSVSVPIVVEVRDQEGLADTLCADLTIQQLLPPENFTLSDIPNDNGHAVQLKWSLSPNDSAISFYYIYRSRHAGFTDSVPVESFQSLDDLIEVELLKTILICKVPSGSTSYTDYTVPVNGVPYYYWIASATADGAVSKPVPSCITVVVTDEKPAMFALKKPYPNPFNLTTMIGYSLPKTGPVSLVIYNSSGQKVRTLVNQTQDAAQYATLWNGRDDSGIPVASGIYFCRLTAGRLKQMEKMVLMK